MEPDAEGPHSRTDLRPLAASSRAAALLPSPGSGPPEAAFPRLSSRRCRPRGIAPVDRERSGRTTPRNSGYPLPPQRQAREAQLGPPPRAPDHEAPWCRSQATARFASPRTRNSEAWFASRWRTKTSASRRRPDKRLQLQRDEAYTSKQAKLEHAQSNGKVRRHITVELAILVGEVEVTIVV